MDISVGVQFAGKPSGPPAGPTYTLIVSDSFDRADNLNLVMADTGQAWSQDQGGWKVVSNRATSKVVNPNTSSLATGVTDMRVEAKAIAFGSGSMTLLGRMTNTTNFVRLYFDSGNLILSQLVGVTSTTLATVSVAVVSGQTVALEIQGSSARGYLDGVLKLSGTTTVLSGTRAGLSNYDTGDIVDDFKVFSIT